MQRQLLLMKKVYCLLQKNKIHFLCDGIDRSGWLIQQFIKLNGDKICSSSKFLVIDADTVLIRPQIFEYNNKDILLFSDEFHEPYYQVFEKIFAYKTKDQISCVTHHMLFDIEKLKKMKAEIEHIHKKLWHDAILDILDYSQLSCFSEYELYGHWVCKNFTSDVCRRYFYNIALSKERLRDISKLERQYSGAQRSISFHSYL